MTRVRSACYHCGDRSPKDEVGEWRHRTKWWLFVSVMTWGLGLFLYPLFWYKAPLCYCPRCRRTYED